MDAVRHAESVGHLGTLAPSWVRALRAQNKAPKTIATYQEASEQFLRFLEARGMPMQAEKIGREYVEAFIEELVQTKAAATAANRYRGLQSLFKWLEAEGEIRSNPMARMSPPAVPEQEVPVLPEADIKALLKTCSAGKFRDLRDEAILRIFLDAGLRLSEVANLRFTPDDDETHDIDLDRGVLYVTRKGRREGVAFIGRNTVAAIDKYIRRGRSRHRLAHQPDLFLGRKGGVTPSGIRQMIEDRALAAGIGKVHPHQLRHSAVHMMKAAGMPDELIMSQAGWRSNAMLHRYAKSARQQRLEAAWKKFSPGDRF